jgi:hypothetical protein
VSLLEVAEFVAREGLTGSPGRLPLERATSALRFWAALRDVFLATREQHCWLHKTADVPDALPRRLHESAKAALGAIYGAPTRATAVDARPPASRPLRIAPDVVSQRHTFRDLGHRQRVLTAL